jgi:hypothetical protein
MKFVIRTLLAGLLLCAAGCTVSAEAVEETSEADIVTEEGTVSSVSNGNVKISYETEDGSKTESLPDNAIVLKENCTLHPSDLKENEDVKISFANGKMSVVEVMPSQNEDKSTDKTENVTEQASAEQTTK